MAIMTTGTRPVGTSGVRHGRGRRVLSKLKLVALEIFADSVPAVRPTFVSMPSRVEVHKHYRSDKDYRRDALAMEKRGWRVERASTHEVPPGFPRRILTGPQSRVERDVHYLRETWEV